jgi:hypothetical protein
MLVPPSLTIYICMSFTAHPLPILNPQLCLSLLYEQELGIPYSLKFIPDLPNCVHIMWRAF